MRVILKLVFILFIFSITSCKYCNMAEGVKNDSVQAFKLKKDFFVKFKFEGVIDTKKQCDNCNVNKYQITIKLDSFKIDHIDFSNRFNEPYYTFNEKELLVLSVSKTLFDLLKEQDRVIKGSNSLFIKFRNYNIPILSEKEFEWLPLGVGVQ